MEDESEKTLRIIEYWKKAYDATNKNNSAKKFSIYNDISSIDFKNSDDSTLTLPYEPTAVLAKAPSPTKTKRFSIYDLSYIGFTT